MTSFFILVITKWNQKAAFHSEYGFHFFRYGGFLYRPYANSGGACKVRILTWLLRLLRLPKGVLSGVFEVRSALQWPVRLGVSPNSVALRFIFHY